MDKRILTLAGVVLLIAGVIFFMKFFNREKCSTPLITIEPGRTVTAKQTVSFSYADAKPDDQAHWIFSDGKEEEGASITRYFQTPGTCTVQLIVNNNNDCSALDSVIVTEPATDPVAPVVAKYSILCPDLFWVGVPYQFKAVGDGGKVFQWDFGETGDYQPKSDISSCTYKFGTQGSYTIKLLVDGDISATKTVNVKIKGPAVGGGGGPAKPKPVDTAMPAKIVEMLNQYGYAAKNNDDDLQSETVKKLLMKLCGNEVVPVERHNKPAQSFEKYIQSMSFRFNEVKGVELEYDGNGCITKIKITE